MNGFYLPVNRVIAGKDKGDGFIFCTDLFFTGESTDDSNGEIRRDFFCHIGLSKYKTLN